MVCGNLDTNIKGHYSTIFTVAWALKYFIDNCCAKRLGKIIDDFILKKGILCLKLKFICYFWYLCAMYTDRYKANAALENVACNTTLLYPKYALCNAHITAFWQIQMLCMPIKGVNCMSWTVLGDKGLSFYAANRWVELYLSMYRGVIKGRRCVSVLHCILKGHLWVGLLEKFAWLKNTLAFPREAALPPLTPCWDTLA